MNSGSLHGKQPKSPGKSWVERPSIICLLLVAATLLSFWPVTHSEFINYDDQDYVTENPHVQKGPTWDGLHWAFTSTYASNWHPLTWLSHMLDVQLFAKAATGP